MWNDKKLEMVQFAVRVLGVPYQYHSTDAPYSFVLAIHSDVNPLTPELNPSSQRCLTRSFTGDYAS
jgi:hypothetical protein